VKIEVNLGTPLIPGFPLKLKDGTTIWGDVKYERLPSFCYACGAVGHDSKSCATAPLHDTIYGPWMKAEIKQMSPMFLASAEECSSA